MTQAEIRNWFVAHLASLLQREPAEIDPKRPFAELNINSAALVSLSGDIEDEFDCDLSPTVLWEYATIEAFSAYLARELSDDVPQAEPVVPQAAAVAEPRVGKDSAENAIAVVGMGCRFPNDVSTPAEFWTFLASGGDGVGVVPEDRWDIDHYFDPDVYSTGKMYTKAGAFLDDAFDFDADFFSLSPREALRMDPQQRILLEVAYEAMENAGYAPQQLSGSATGVFIGIVASQYTQRQLNADATAAVDDPYFSMGSACSVAAGRLSYLFNLQGPNVSLDTACSSSLVALHTAVRSLRNGECNMALVGGVNVVTEPEIIVNACKMRMLSPTGSCKTFDAGADGFAFGEGCAVVVVKRLQDALDAGDNVLAVIRGTATNQDGRSNGLTAPNKAAQEAVIRQALRDAEVDASDISYVETHGTGTKLGDPIELGALSRVLLTERSKTNPVHFGSVKTNIGHLAAGAGIAGFSKTVLALQNKQIPPHRNFDTPNPHIEWDEKMRIPVRLTPWESDGEPRRAGLSSFGWSGSNVHAILEEAPQQADSGASRKWQLLLLSARSANALEAATDRLATTLQATDSKLADIAYTLQTGRDRFDHRRAIVCRGASDGADIAQRRDPLGLGSGTVTEGERDVTFMFPGLGDQYANMAQQLYDQEPVFRRVIDECCRILHPYLGVDLCFLLYGSEAPSEEPAAIDLRAVMGRVEKAVPRSVLAQTAIAQPLLFVIEYALAQLWMSWGIRPNSLIGYSIGEYVAACISGIFSLKDGLRLVAERARLIATVETGNMLAVVANERDARGYLSKEISLAAVNGPMMCVLAGSSSAIARVQGQLRADGLACRRVQATHAFHSHMMDAIADDMLKLASSLDLSTPQIPIMSNVSGDWMTDEQALDPSYWVQHLCQTVRFADGLAKLWEEPARAWVEVGVGNTLGSLAMQHPDRADDAVVVKSLSTSFDRRDDLAVLLQSLGTLWMAGIEADWDAFYAGETRRRVPLPTYPFERQRFWIAPTKLVQRQQSQVTATKKPLADWFYLPTWRRQPLLRSAELNPADHQWLIFADRLGIADTLTKQIEERGGRVNQAVPADSFTRVSDTVYGISPDAANDYAELIKHLYLSNQAPTRIIHLWGVTETAPATEDGLRDGFYSALYLAQALGARPDTVKAKLRMVTNGAQTVFGDDGNAPIKSAVFGPLRVIGNEYAELSCTTVDLPAVAPAQAATQLLQECLVDDRNDMVAYRGRTRWVQAFEPLSLDTSADGQRLLRSGGTYLITGGFGGLGYALAQELAHQGNPNLVLMSRTPLPNSAEFDAVLTANDNPVVVQRIKQLRQLESLGATVLSVGANVADLAQVETAVAQAVSHFGRIDGLFHVAGVPGEGLMQFKSTEQAAAVLAPKVQGTINLHSALASQTLDFSVLFSSSNAITGGVGESDYCAANAFMDAYAHHNSEQGTPTVAINWGAWQHDAWQSSMAETMPAVYAEIKQYRATFGFSFDEGMTAMWRALAVGSPQVVVVTQELDEVRAQWERMSSADLLQSAKKNSTPTERFPRPDLRTPYVAPQSETQETVAKIWADALALEKVGIHDHFHELGGNSLIGMMIIDQLETAFEVKLSAATLYEGPTVHALAEIIRPDQTQTEQLKQHSDRGSKRNAARRRRKRVRA